jgi:N-acetylmuramoyl-L-alanine amidase
MIALTLRMLWRCGWASLLGCVVTCASPQAQSVESLAHAMATRYAPYADWPALFDIEQLVGDPAPRYWQTAAEIDAAREAADLPLAGLHLALDPGHIGGAWAAAEGRHFRIAADDFYVREGELVLEVAQRVQAALVELGAEVTLLRETSVQVNPKGPVDYLQLAAQQVLVPAGASLAELVDYGAALRARAVRLSIVVEELAARARLVNETIRPDALLSFHINAAPWPESPAGARLQLVDSNHVHALIFGCMSQRELQSAAQQAQLAVKLRNGSAAAERRLGAALSQSLAAGTGLPASRYGGKNAILLDAQYPYLYARNLLLLRSVECPTVLLEPYVANSQAVYSRLQDALTQRASGAALAADDILLEYADAVVAGVLACYAAE